MSRFYISLEDELFRRYGSHDHISSKSGPAAPASPVDHSCMLDEIDRAQRIIEGQNLELRRTLNKYSSIMEQHRRMIDKKRQGLLDGSLELTLFEEHAPDRFSDLRERLGADALRDLERQIRLYHLDLHWTCYLQECDLVREGIHLLSVQASLPMFAMVPTTPLTEFNRTIIEIFAATCRRMDEDSVRMFESLPVTATGVDLSVIRSRRPSSTWTYLVNDHPFSDTMEKLLRPVTDVLKAVLGNKRQRQ